MFTSKNLKKICAEAQKIIAEVAVFIKTEKNKVVKSDIEAKGLNDLVSYTPNGIKCSKLKELKI